MKRHQAYKYELMPTGQQQRDMRRFAGSCRFVFNKALAWQRERYDQGEKPAIRRSWQDSFNETKTRIRKWHVS